MYRLADKHVRKDGQQYGFNIQELYCYEKGIPRGTEFLDHTQGVT
jgi:hypothetical protein